MPLNTTNQKVVVVIPARMASGRLPGKPLLPIDGKPMLQHTYDAAKKTCASSVVVASSDNEIVEYCVANDISCIRTSQKPVTGTHRVAEAVGEFFQRGFRGDELVVNIQCDEPFFNPKDVNDLVCFAEVTKQFDVWTIVARIDTLEKAWLSDNPDITKAVISEKKQAYWFSRASMLGSGVHCGIYAYTARTVLDLGKLDITYLSITESLEQLAWIEHGYRVGAWIIDELPQSINTKEDYEAVIGKAK